MLAGLEAVGGDWEFAGLCLPNQSLRLPPPLCLSRRKKCPGLNRETGLESGERQRQHTYATRMRLAEVAQRASPHAQPGGCGALAGTRPCPLQGCGFIYLSRLPRPLNPPVERGLQSSSIRLERSEGSAWWTQAVSSPAEAMDSPPQRKAQRFSVRCVAKAWARCGFSETNSCSCWVNSGEGADRRMA